jgi:hypothetical protein
VAGAARALGIAGAVLLLAAFTLAGVGFLQVAIAAQAAVQCHGSCETPFRAEVNASIAEGEYLGIGVATAGVGASLVFAGTFSMIQRPAELPRASTVVSPPPIPPDGGPG